MKNKLLLFAFSLMSVCSMGQKSLEGVWVGTITDGLKSTVGYKFEMILEIEGEEIKGRSYVHIGPDEVIEMELRGRMYWDRSLYMHDIQFIPTEGQDVLPPFNRKYQFAYDRSIWESTLEGYWQEIRDDAFNPKRQRGRIILKKTGNTKA
ncbi:MAG: hypothetical protein R2824_00630 [Saprospiraceae bacterium]|nr:hypothetical protein [Lewinella sp.]